MRTRVDVWQVRARVGALADGSAAGIMVANRVLVVARSGEMTRSFQDAASARRQATGWDMQISLPWVCGHIRPLVSCGRLVVPPAPSRRTRCPVAWLRRGMRAVRARPFAWPGGIRSCGRPFDWLGECSIMRVVVRLTEGPARTRARPLDRMGPARTRARPIGWGLFACALIRTHGHGQPMRAHAIDRAGAIFLLPCMRALAIRQ